MGQAIFTARLLEEFESLNLDFLFNLLKIFLDETNFVKFFKYSGS